MRRICDLFFCSDLFKWVMNMKGTRAFFNVIRVNSNIGINLRMSQEWKQEQQSHQETHMQEDRDRVIDRSMTHFAVFSRKPMTAMCSV